MQLDENGEPAKIIHVSEIGELDLTPARLLVISTPELTLQATRPVDVRPYFEDQQVVIEMPEFGIIAEGATREEAIETLQEDIVWLWLEYVNAPEERLSGDARRLRCSLQEMFREAE